MVEDYTEINFLEEAVLSVNKSYKVTLLMGQENCTGHGTKLLKKPSRGSLVEPQSQSES